MFPHTITVYNRYIASGTERWQRTALKGVLWDATAGRATRTTGIFTANSAKVIIPARVQSTGAHYVSPAAWGTRPSKAGAWTLQPGDIIAAGDTQADITSSPTELQATAEARQIISVDAKGFGSRLDHWEVGLK